MSRSLRDLDVRDLLEHWEAEISRARHWQEFAQLPVPKGDEEIRADNEERFSLAVARCAAVRRHALERRPDLFGAYPWPAGFGDYDEALSDLDRKLAERRAKENS